MKSLLAATSESNARNGNGAAATAGDALTGRLQATRDFSTHLCAGLAPEDMVVQSMADVSPTKWHLAHTSWFFETFVLGPNAAGYRVFDPAFAYLFNSYYVQAGERHCRDQRGYISRPTVREVLAYRAHVDEGLTRFLERDEASPEVRALIELGIQHEQQHQELMLTDIKHVFAVNPLRPPYAPSSAGAEPPQTGSSSGWHSVPEGLHTLGWKGSGFAYDNEGPSHRAYVHAFELGTRLVTNEEYLAFMNDGGYQRAELWLSMGWEAVQRNAWSEPFYWEKRDGEWWHYTLGGMRPLALHEAVCHVSYFEADAYARWAGARLPTEAEWEVVALTQPVEGNFVESGALHPQSAGSGEGVSQLFGDVWEWTQSQYSPYPGFKPAAGAVGEYNGKFMCNQFVLRGGSCATSATHIRPTYRNFFPPAATWQFTGLRLARDLR